MGIGVGVAAHIRFKEGLIITSSNFKIPFKNYPMRDRIQSHFEVPVILDNDANAQAYGEFVFGAGRGRGSVVFMTVSSGIGAGIIIDGKLFRGMTGTAGEVGHTITQFESDQRCTCGNLGCLMAQASGIFFPSMYQKKLEQGKRTVMEVRDTAAVDGRTIAEGVRLGDEIGFFKEEDKWGIGHRNEGKDRLWTNASREARLNMVQRLNELLEAIVDELEKRLENIDELKSSGSSGYMLEQSSDDSEQVIGPASITLTGQAAIDFAEMVLSPAPEPTPVLLRAAELHKKTVISE